MSQKTSDGGPAFPRPASEYTASGTLMDGNDAIREQDGMSLRDYFAANANVSWGDAIARLERDFGSAWVVEDVPVYIAELRYAIADAMLKARENV